MFCTGGAFRIRIRPGGLIQMSILFYTSPIHIFNMSIAAMQLIKIQLSEAPLKIKFIALDMCSWCASRVARCQFYLMDSLCVRRKSFGLFSCASFWLRKIHRLHDLLSLNVFRLLWPPPSTSALQQSTRLSSKSVQPLVEEGMYEEKGPWLIIECCYIFTMFYYRLNFVCGKQHGTVMQLKHAIHLPVGAPLSGRLSFYYYL